MNLRQRFRHSQSSPIKDPVQEGRQFVQMPATLLHQRLFSSFKRFAQIFPLGFF